MTFLNPFVLFGLAAAVIPLILHLLNIRKLRTIEFSTLVFLKELQKSTIRRIKIRQWLLLLLRTLVILFLVLAFSRPALKGSLAGAGSHAKTTMVILFDDTYSMSLQNENGSFIKQARTVASRLVGMMQEGDDAFYVRLSDLPDAVQTVPTQDTKKLLELIRQTEISFKHRTLDEALRVASRLLSQSRNLNKEIYIISDGQASSFSPSEKAELKQDERLFESQTKLFILQLSDKIFENVGIEKVTIPPSLFQKGKSFLLRASVKNYGTSPVKNRLLSIFLDGTRVMQKSISLGSGATTVAEFTVTPQHTGFFSGHVELEDDELEADNTMYFSVFIPDQINAVMISSIPGQSEYIRLALNLSTQETAPTPVAWKEIIPAQISLSTLSQSDVVIFAGVKELTQVQAEYLGQFLVERGGGLLFFPDAEMNRDNYNKIILPALHLPSILPIQSDSVVGAAPMKFEKIDRDHPIFQGMFEHEKIKQEQGVLESPQLQTILKFSSEKNLRPIVVLGNGRPFLWEKNSGEGRIIGFSVPPTTQWSDFPLKGIFIPLLYQSVLYLSGPISNVEPMENVAGNPIEISSTRFRQQIRTAQSSRMVPIQIIDPGKKETALQSYTKNLSEGRTATVYTFDQAMLPGMYILRQGRDTIAIVPVNMDRAESDGSRIEEEKVISLIKRYGIAEKQISFLKPDDALDTIVLQSRFGIELWKYFLLAAFLTAIGEMIVARESKQEAFG